MRIPLLAVVVLALTLGRGGTLAAHDCIVFPVVEEEFAAASAVFVGRVIATSYLVGYTCFHCATGYATFVPERSWKGPLTSTITVYSNRFFKVGQEYLVFAFEGEEPETLFAEGCNSTGPLDSDERPKSSLQWLQTQPSRRIG